MENSDRPDVLTLAERYGSMAMIPEDVLAAHHYRRYKDGLTNLLVIADADEVDRGPARARWLRKNYPGYIFAGDWYALREMLNGRHVVRPKDRRRIKARAEEFIAAGIPPIFDPRFATGGFPIIDAIIAWCSGALAATTCARKISAGKAGIVYKPIGKILPVTVKNVQTFRCLAFTEDGTIEPLLIEDNILSMRENFDFENDKTQAYVESRTREAFAFLEDILRDLPHEPRTVVTDPRLARDEMLRDRRWYLGVAPGLRETVVREIFADKAANVKTDARRRLRVLFPEVAAEVLASNRVATLAELEARIEHALATGKLRNLPSEAYRHEVHGPRLCELAVEQYFARLEALAAEDPNQFCSTSGMSYNDLPLAVQEMIGLKTIIERLDALRLRFFQGLRDDQFVRVLTPMDRRSPGIGSLAVRKTERKTTEATTALRAFLVERTVRLRTPRTPPVSRPATEEPRAPDPFNREGRKALLRTLLDELTDEEVDKILAEREKR